ncbi:uncharacterized protein PG986_012118 [Apiospora aurea]|uniref:Uncharacterized protein n=1 Tax=Apiospora aurea TaxID=335848 RepID=A0ABR1PZ44_9PEZI
MDMDIAKLEESGRRPLPDTNEIEIEDRRGYGGGNDETGGASADAMQVEGKENKTATLTTKCRTHAREDALILAFAIWMP